MERFDRLKVLIFTGALIGAWLLAGCQPAAPGTSAGSTAADAGTGMEATTTSAGGLRIEKAWARPGFSGGNSAVYLTVINEGSNADRLVGVETEIAAAAEIHESKMENNVMHMHPVAGVDLPAGDRAELSPGGLHIMLIDLQEELAEGATISLQLQFEQADPMTVTAQVSLTGEAAETHVYHGLVYDPVEPAPDFELIDPDGQTVHLSDFQGKVVLLYFGFTNCPDACPLTLANWNLVHQNLGEQAEQVRFVFITVDPERDTPAVIGKHLALFNDAFIGLWGSLDEIEDVARAYNVYLEKVEVDSAVGYLVNHATLTFIVDRQGRLVLAHQPDASPQELAEDIQHLLH